MGANANLQIIISTFIGDLFIRDYKRDITVSANLKKKYDEDMQKRYDEESSEERELERSRKRRRMSRY